MGKLKVILDRFDSRINIKTEVNRLMRAATVRSEDCPWVKIGRAFASISITGDESWMPVIRSGVEDFGYKQFVIYTGRHGDICNRYDDKFCPTGVIDPKHVKEDSDLIEKYKGELKMMGVTIEMKDTGDWKTNHTSELKNHCIQQMAAGKCCIFAWCYGLFTFCEESLTQDDKDYAACLETLKGCGLVGQYGKVNKPSKWTPLPQGVNLGDAEAAFNRNEQLKKTLQTRTESDVELANCSVASITKRYWAWADLYLGDNKAKVADIKHEH